MKLEGKVAIVTGGARDLGRAISVKLAAEGAKVCLNYFDNEADAQETLALIKNVGGEAIAVQGDMTKAAAVKNLFADRNRDFVTELDEQNIILIKDATDLKTEEDALHLAKTIVDNLHAEAMVRVRVGYGNTVNTLQDIAKSYQEAKMALEVGRIFNVEEETISYGKLGIGRLIYQLPMSLCEMFIKEIFGERNIDLDDETMVTIQKFFENSLNISETARQLYIHRNTLVYRLERLEKMIGLDIRKFEDAMTFKIAMMVIAHMDYQN